MSPFRLWSTGPQTPRDQSLFIAGGVRTSSEDFGYVTAKFTLSPNKASNDPALLAVNSIVPP